MTGRESFEDALDAAIDALRAGRSLDRVLADHPMHAASLAPVLDTVLHATADGGGYVPPSPRLVENVAIVRAAAQRAQMAAGVTPTSPVVPVRGSWWNRRLTFASLSIPVGIAVFALGAGGAAAAAGVAAVTTDVPAQFARAAMPSWAEDAVPGLAHDDGAALVEATPDAGATAPGGDKTETPGDVNRLTPAEVDGIVTNVRGNTFTLTSVDGEWKVQVDSKTIVTGDIADGATALVSGDVTAEKNLHANEVDVTAAVPTPTTDDAKPQKTPPGADKTPGPPPSKTPKPEKTPGPPEDRTPQGNPDSPDQGEGQGPPEGNGNDGENGNGGGNGNGQNRP